MSNAARPEVDEEADPPAAELGLEVDEDEEGDEDDLLPCDMDGEDDEPELLFESSAA